MAPISIAAIDFNGEMPISRTVQYKKVNWIFWSWFVFIDLVIFEFVELLTNGFLFHFS